RFEINGNAAAISCVAGKMIVQQSDLSPSLVNVIIKPNDSNHIKLDINYFVYRGISKNSLIVGNSIIPNSESNNEFIRRLYDDAKGGIIGGGTPGLFGTAGVLGFDGNQVSGDTLIEDIFDGLPHLYSMPILEGEVFGEFPKQYTDNNNLTV